MLFTKNMTKGFLLFRVIQSDNTIQSPFPNWNGPCTFMLPIEIRLERNESFSVFCTNRFLLLYLLSMNHLTNPNLNFYNQIISFFTILGCLLNIDELPPNF